MLINYKKNREMYEAKPGDYYAKQMKTSGLGHLWFRKRQFLTSRLVKKYNIGRSGAIGSKGGDS